jgi:hypothetical protein
MQNIIRLLVSALIAVSVTGCVAVPNHAPGKQLLNLVPSLIGKDSSALVESLGLPHDEVWVNDTKHVTWRYLQLFLGECRLSTANKGGKVIGVHWSGPLTGCHYLESKIKRLNLNN